MKLTINIKPEDILTVTPTTGGRALVSMAIGNSVEVMLTVEEKAEDVMDMLMSEGEVTE